MDPYHSLSDLLYYDQVIAPNGMLTYMSIYLHDSSGYPLELAKTIDGLTSDYRIINLPDDHWFGNEPQNIALVADNEQLREWIHRRQWRCPSAREMVRRCHSGGLNVSAQLRSDTFGSVFYHGSTEVAVAVYNSLPTIDPEHLDSDMFLGFLRSEETQIRRRRMRAWENDIAMKVKNGTMETSHVPDLIATSIDEYSMWLKKSGMKLRSAKYEFLIYGLLSALTIVTLPLAVSKYFKYRRLRLDLSEDEKVPGRELAYISDAKTSFRPHGGA